MKRVNDYSKTAMYIFAIIALLGANSLGLFSLFAPNKTIGQVFFITFAPLLVGLVGLLLAYLIFKLTKARQKTN